MIGHDAKAKTIAIILKMDLTNISKEVKRTRTQLSRLTKDPEICPKTKRDPLSTIIVQRSMGKVANLLSGKKKEHISIAQLIGRHST
jgi:hypothetical protein